MGADGKGAAGGAAGVGVGDHGHARWQNARTFNSSGRVGTKGVQVHTPIGGA